MKGSLSSKSQYTTIAFLVVLFVLALVGLVSISSYARTTVIQQPQPSPTPSPTPIPLNPAASQRILQLESQIQDLRDRESDVYKGAGVPANYSCAVDRQTGIVTCYPPTQPSSTPEKK